MQRDLTGSPTLATLITDSALLIPLDLRSSSHPVSPSFVLSSQMQSIPPESVGLGKLRGAPCQTRGRHGSQAPLPTRSVLLRLCSERVSLGKVPPHLLSLEISPCLAF